eukprot:13639253-Heterocapsa_arctica.AAC.1
MGEEVPQADEEPEADEGEEYPEVELYGMSDDDKSEPFYIDERSEFNLLTEDREEMCAVTKDHGDTEGWVKVTAV